MASTASEFGGRGVQKNTIYGPPHSPEAYEKLRLVYLTGQDEDSTVSPDSEGDAFQGLLKLREQLELQEKRGDFEMGVPNE
jgi:hypothetical protein